MSRDGHLKDNEQNKRDICQTAIHRESRTVRVIVERFITRIVPVWVLRCLSCYTNNNNKKEKAERKKYNVSKSHVSADLWKPEQIVQIIDSDQWPSYVLWENISQQSFVDLTTWYLADPLQPRLTVKGSGEERCGGQVVEQIHKKVSQRAPGCLVRTQSVILLQPTVKQFYDCNTDLWPWLTDSGETALLEKQWPTQMSCMMGKIRVKVAR